jgi:hypothetical protein
MLIHKSKFSEKDFDIFDDFKTNTNKPEKQRDIKYLPWVEKFRPQELSEIISNKEIIGYLIDCIKALKYEINKLKFKKKID